MHDHRDQFIRVEDGTATVTLGPSQDKIEETHQLADDWAVIVPGGTWHNVINTGDTPLRLYSCTPLPSIRTAWSIAPEQRRRWPQLSDS